MLFPGETKAIEEVLKAGSEYGYGNMIAHLKTAWAKRLMSQGVSKEAALDATNVSAYPIEDSKCGCRSDMPDGEILKCPSYHATSDEYWKGYRAHRRAHPGPKRR